MIYTYRCNSCSEVFEKDIKDSIDSSMKSLGYNSNPRCIKCHSSSTIKIITAPAIIYKDKGFTKYVTREE